MFEYTDYEVSIAICKDVLNELPNRDKYSQFLIFYINKEKNKANVVLDDWNEFMKYWQDKFNEDKTSNEITEPFFSFIRGYFTPYREKYADNANGVKETPLEGSSFDKLCQIVNRHYATIKFLIVKNPQQFQDKVKIDFENVLTPNSFFNYLETKQPDLIKEFTLDYDSQQS